MKKMEWIISRIPYLKNQAMIIYLGQRSPAASSNLPGNIGRAALKRFPIWFCSRWGLPCLSCHHESGELLPRRFTLASASRGGLFSVALSRSRPRFALRTTLPCGVRTFLRPVKPAITHPLQNYLSFVDSPVCQLIRPLVLITRHMVDGK